MKYIRLHTQRFVFLIALFVAVAGLSACGGGSTAASSTTIGGSAGDGPITGGAITVTDANSKAVTTTPASPKTDANTAHFSFTIPSGTATPVTITITGGTDQTTGAAATIPLMTAVTVLTAGGSVTSNANPLSTLAVESAMSVGGSKFTVAQLSTAKTNILNALGFGLPAGIDPITTKVTAANVAGVLKANEAAAELIRRVKNSAALSFANTIKAIAEDLTDGVVDGKVKTGVTATKASAKIAAMILVKQAKVAAEVIADKLNVTDGAGTNVVTAANFVTKLKAALKKTQPNATTAEADITKIAPTQAFLDQAKKAVAAAKALSGSTALDALRAKFGALTAGTALTSTEKTAIETVITGMTATTAFTDADTAAGAGGSTVTTALTTAANADVTPPGAPSISSPTANATVTTQTPTVSGTAEAGSTVTLFSGTTSVGTATASSSGVWSITSAALSNASHTLTAKATDAAGNVSIVSTGVAITVNSGTNIAGAVIDGKVSGATLTLYSDKGLSFPIGGGSTDANGAFNINLLPLVFVMAFNDANGNNVLDSGELFGVYANAASNGLSYAVTPPATNIDFTIEAVASASVVSGTVGGTTNGTGTISGTVNFSGTSGTVVVAAFSDPQFQNSVGTPAHISVAQGASGSYQITGVAGIIPDPIYIKSTGGTDLDTGMPAPTMRFVGNTSGANALTTLNVTPLTDDVMERVNNGSTLSAAQTNAQTAFGLTSNTGTDGLYEDPSAAANTGLLTAEFKKLTAGTIGGTIVAGTYKMFAIVLADADIGTRTVTGIGTVGTAATTVLGSTMFVDASLTVATNGDITGTDTASGNPIVGKIVGSSMLFDIVDSTTTTTHVTCVVGNIGLQGSIAGNFSDVNGLPTTPVMHKGVFVGSLVPASGVSATGLATFISRFYSPGATTGLMNVVARDIFLPTGAGNIPRVHWGRVAVTAVDPTVGTLIMSDMSMRQDGQGGDGGAATAASTFTFSAGKYVNASSVPTNLLVFSETIPGGGTDKVYIVTAMGLRRGIYFVVPSATHTVSTIGESYMSKVDSAAPSAFTAGHTHTITIANIHPTMAGSSRTSALANGLSPSLASSAMTIPATVTVGNGYWAVNSTTPAPELMVFQGSTFAMKKDANDNFAENIVSGAVDDHLRLVEFFDSGAMQGEEIMGGTVTTSHGTITLRNFPETFIGFVHDNASSVTPSFSGSLKFLARTVYASSYAGFANAYVSGTLTITAPTTTAGSATLVATPAGGSSTTATLTVDAPGSTKPGVYHIHGAFGTEYIDITWPIGGTKALYAVSSGTAGTGTVSEVGEAFLTE